MGKRGEREGKMEGLEMGELIHLLTTVFVSGFAGFLTTPAITDVTVAALCSPGADECSLAVYLSGFQQAAIGLGTMVMMPVMGNLSDKYGIKALLTLPMALSIIPPAILGYKRDRDFFYAYYISRTLTAMVCEGTVDCLAYAYVAENISEIKRISAFSVLAGVKTISSVCGTLAARFLSIASTFQIAAVSWLIGLVYMRVFLKERLHDHGDDDDDGHHHHHGEHHGEDHPLAEPILKDTPAAKARVFNKNSSLKDIISLMKTSTVFVQALVVTFFSSFSDSGMQSAFLYFLKARFGFNKDQFADLMLLVSIIGSITQLFLLSILASAMGERRLLSLGLLMEVVNTAIVSVSWSAWVPYLTTVFAPGAMIVMPSVCNIASKQVGPGDQGKAQGCISGVKSFGKVIAPFVFSPVTALFLSDDPPFYFPGFSLLCISLSSMIGFIQSLVIKDDPPPSSNQTINPSSEEEGVNSTYR
ncbi:PREDICTED: uncharacterized protein LOC104819660 [Tarenaya hassleriana]|uniref:uncharacterized protein LOC104819660 n=1 Tax=Tarenaya hassleriana TaxID=28532 RepID=UPI00053C3A54|nr:PREDICTED: uncharacterized protein LOC104819660 [Tarenaya hassleriana]